MRRVDCSGKSLLIAAVVILPVCVLLWRIVPSEPDRPIPVDVARQPIAPIPPGTVIADGVAEGWSHLIIKSQPRIGVHSAEHVSASTTGLVELTFTAIVADVQPEADSRWSTRFRLSKVAAGVGMAVGGQEMILSSDTQEELGAELGILDRTALAGGEKHVRKMCCAARSPTMVIVDAPNLFYLREKHLPAVLRYAMLVDPKTGRLDTLLWLLEEQEDGSYAGPIGPMQWLPSNCVEDCLLHVDPDAFVLGFPTAKAFARAQVPQGRRSWEFPAELKSPAAKFEFTADTARHLEQQLRGLLSRESASD